ncbi:hypothetical protein QFZ66_007785 [Streptomyces sp. B4I13]|nr:hypothetical protein [Streptomyces sp. B4I13]
MVQGQARPAHPVVGTPELRGAARADAVPVAGELRDLRHGHRGEGRDGRAQAAAVGGLVAVHQRRPVRGESERLGVLGRRRLPADRAPRRRRDVARGRRAHREGEERRAAGRRPSRRRAARRGDAAAPPVGLDQTVAAQHLQRLPHGLSADAEAPGQPALARQPFAGRDGLAQLTEQLRRDPPVQGPVVGGRGGGRGDEGGAAGHAARLL